MKRSLFTSPPANPRSDTPQSTPDHTLDILIIGAGFAGCYSLYRLRQSGFRCKILEAGTQLGGVWAFNSYPGARTDSPCTVYAFNIPQIYEKWKWKELYSGHQELKDYFHFVGTELELYRDVMFNQSVTHLTYNETERSWDVKTEQGMYVKAKYVVACTGFAAKRHFPDWKGFDSFRGEMYHSSFWPKEGVNVEGKKVGVVGTGATGVQIVQEWAKEVGEVGSVKVFQSKLLKDHDRGDMLI